MGYGSIFLEIFTDFGTHHREEIGPTVLLFGTSLWTHIQYDSGKVQRGRQNRDKSLFYFISFCDVDPLTRMAVPQHRPQSTTNSRRAWPELGLSCAAHHWGRRCASEGPGFGRRIGGIGVNSIIIREYANWAWFMALWIPHWETDCLSF